jgi:hypothetical protein
MSLSSWAGKSAKPSMLVNVPRLMTACYTHRPHPAVPEQGVVFGTSGHRGSAFAPPITHLKKGNSSITRPTVTLLIRA